ncbi:MerR family transcriptional regulator [Cytobacillus praedii]|uniref:MerR family transcriptional regulator n=1 Tax=Cytobacillus praedii TaxID=1742358 RepID=UPI002E21013E|nr:MerR family transcriptional regulator [Cytobacillus praedii]MED3575813.1 MerR family transcriptional regulator [Cytobacillus praedii]
MNTSAVAKLLGVSSSTIQRWVKQLELQMDRNELGHYSFTDGDIQLLKQVQEQLKKGVMLQDVTVEGKKTRIGVVKPAANEQIDEKLLEKIKEFEQRLNKKADDVVSYQLLQHRREIEELQAEVEKLTQRIECIEEWMNKEHQRIPSDHAFIFDKELPKKKTKRKNLITSLFGF